MSRYILTKNYRQWYNLFEVIILVKQTKNRMPYSTSLDKYLVAKLQELSNKTRIPAAYLLDEAIEDLLRKYQKGE